MIASIESIKMMAHLVAAGLFFALAAFLFFLDWKMEINPSKDSDGFLSLFAIVAIIIALVLFSDAF